MTTALLLLLSAALIVSGVAIVWRDVLRNRRQAFLVRGDAIAAHPDAEVTVAHQGADEPLPPLPPLGGPGSHAADPVPSLSETAQTLGAAAQWAVLQPVIASAVNQVNAVLRGANVEIGGPGEPSWSVLKRGYGVHRRLLVGGESVAWLRIELDANGQLQAGVKAHKDDLAIINASSRAAPGAIDITHVSDLLSECLKPAVSLAMRTANGGSTEQWASESAWRTIDPLVSAALRAANGALSQAGARFLPRGGPAWVEDTRRHRLAVAVEVLGTEAARLLIECIGDELEVAVGLPDAHLAHLGRRQRVPLRGLTTHALAELIATSAWPAIAYVRER